jgi:hypothetical protein
MIQAKESQLMVTFKKIWGFWLEASLENSRMLSSFA